MAAAPSWKDSLRPASFRAVPFLYADIDNNGGRRNAEHEFPQRDQGYTEDLGRKLRRYKVDGYLLGDDYLTQWAKLLAALEKGGPGSLVHPYFGTVTVNVGDLSYNNRTQEGRMMRFSVTFIEAGQQLFPQTQTDPTSAIGNAANALNTSVAVAFARKFSVLGQPAFVVNAATSLLGQASSMISGIIRPLTADANAVAVFANGVAALKSQATALVQLPSNLADSLQASIGQIATVFGANAGTISSILGLTAFGGSLAAVPTTTGARVQQGANQGAMTQLMQITAAAEAARTTVTALVSGGFTTADDANNTRDAVADALDNAMAAADDDAVFSALQELRAQLYVNIPLASQQLPFVVAYTPATTLPLLVIEYDLYESDALEDDIVGRNSIANPGFVPGGKAIEVLSNG